MTVIGKSVRKPWPSDGTGHVVCCSDHTPGRPNGVWVIESLAKRRWLCLFSRGGWRFPMRALMTSSLT